MLSSELSANHHQLELRMFRECLSTCNIKEAGVEIRCEGCRAFNRTYCCYGSYYIKLVNMYTSTIVPTKSDSHVIFCLQLLSI